MIEIKDKNGKEIKDGDKFKYTGTTPPVIGKRIGDEIEWSDGIKSNIGEFWWDTVDKEHSELLEDG